MTEKLLSIEDLDAFFATAPAKPKTKTKAVQPPKPEPKYWIPTEVVLWESQWECACGACGPATPELFVREVCGRQSRLRGIGNPKQYGLLPRVVEQAQPSQVQVCPTCFDGQTEGVKAQLILPFPEDLREFVSKINEAKHTARDILAALEELRRDPPAPIPTQVIRTRETPLPPDWAFIPGDVEFTRGSSVVHYISSATGETGPALPHCYKEINNEF